MIELQVDLFKPDFFNSLDAVCFTSNGVVRSDGKLTMGAGIAKEFANRWPRIPATFGTLVKSGGNKVHVLNFYKPNIVSFPTKYHWRGQSDLELIRKSAMELVDEANKFSWRKVGLNFPGIGMGGLNKNEVREVIKNVLNERFYVVSR